MHLRLEGADVLKLFYSPTSPYARKVRVVLRETGLISRVEEMPANSLAEGAAEIIQNPLSKVPSFVREDGSVLIDSPVICEWLDAQAPGIALVPTDGEARWSCLRRQALADGIMDAAFNTVMENIRSDSEKSQHWLTRWQGAIERSIDAMVAETVAPDERFDLGDITFACALGYVNFRLPQIGWASRLPELSAWYEAHSERSSMLETRPPTG